MLSLFLSGTVFLLCSGAVLLAVRLGESSERLTVRLRELSGRAPARPIRRTSLTELARSSLPKIAAPLLPASDGQRAHLQTRLVQAGFYSRQAMVRFLGAKTFLTFAPWLVALAAGLGGVIAMRHALIWGVMAGGAGMLAPGVWLDRAKKRHQARLRNGLPDVLDILVLSLEGGVSLAAAFRLVAEQIRASHPLLGRELQIVQREIHLGRSFGEALRRFGQRGDLEEISGLASILDQAERFGASLGNALRTQAEQIRFKRLQQVEESAQKAGAKILFPTLLFIFPGIFIILLGPAYFQVKDVMDSQNTQPIKEAPNHFEAAGKRR